MSEMIDGYTAARIERYWGPGSKVDTLFVGQMCDDLKQNIQLHRLIGEMKGSLEMMLILSREYMNVAQISALEDLLKRYEEFFK